MLGGFAKAIFGSSNDRYVRSLRKIVERRDGEIHRLRLVVDLHQERSPAHAAEDAVPEARGSEGAHRLRAPRPDEIAFRHAREHHRRRAGGALASAAMAPAGVERRRLQFVAHRAAGAPTGEGFGHGTPLILRRIGGQPMDGGPASHYVRPCGRSG